MEGTLAGCEGKKKEKKTHVLSRQLPILIVFSSHTDLTEFQKQHIWLKEGTDNLQNVHDVE